MVLSNRSWRTSGYFKALKTLVSSATYDKSIQKTSLLNLENATILANLPVARAKLVKDGFKCKNCLTFDSDRLLAFTELRTDA